MVVNLLILIDTNGTQASDGCLPMVYPNKTSSCKRLKVSGSGSMRASSGSALRLLRFNVALVLSWAFNVLGAEYRHHEDYMDAWHCAGNGNHS